MTWENRSFLEVISHTGAVFSLRVFINVWKHFLCQYGGGWQDGSVDEGNLPPSLMTLF